MKVAVVGASGLVGQKMLQIMSERNFPIEELLPVASERSVGKTISYNGKDYSIISMEDAISAKPDITLFSAGGSVALEYAPKFAEAGSVVIDNSSAWRMDAGKKLIVPEVNGHVLRIDDRIIANPNCSTIQMVVALKPLHDAFKIKRIVVSTYQSVTGSGKGAVDQLEGERTGKDIKKVYPHKIDMNALPHIDVFQENGYTKEEMKMVNETMKIMGDDSIKVTATCVRIPTVGGHSEAINVEFENEYTLEQVHSILEKAPGVTVVDDPSENMYPMPLSAHDKDDVFVGRIRRDETQPKTLNLWVVSDNLRKGAATNTIQIAEYMLQHSLVY
ncbi:aspartate-semialdehyde dehydrogenase [Ekhidna lutea]|uniref:Aspartate-semialdehyde dehydrogenase n=1 Tax=Ekhidna lutea TaxID=447679 RepID=A0A239FDW4_EKHLU|nr:aspartate-semialdehyde dehydrogenase [Ekhidna lutea]SNS54698.1 aspartate-semialdehyde dehydrogenase [Ekhidna lutea]